MQYKPLQQHTAIICIFLTIAAPWMLPGCGQVPGLDLGQLSLSAGTLNPGQFLTLFHKSIAAGKSVTVEFRGAGGYVIQHESFITADGSVKVPVPPFIDTARGTFAPGAVTVSIVGVDSPQTLQINDVMAVDSTKPGIVLRHLLAAAIEEYQETLTNLTIIQSDVGQGFDPSASATQVNAQIATLQALVTEFDATGHVTIQTASGGNTVVSAAQLAVTDRWLASIIEGLAEDFEQQGAGQLAGRTTHKNTLGIRNEGAAQTPQQIADNINFLKTAARGSNLASMVATGVGLVATVVGVVGIVATSEVTILAGAILGAISAVSSFVSAKLTNENSDSFGRARSDFDAAQEAASQAIRYETGVFGGFISFEPNFVPGLINTIASTILGVKDLVFGGISEFCTTHPNDPFCLPATSGGNTSGNTDSTPPPPVDLPGAHGSAFEVISYSNTDGSRGTDANAAQIKVNGSTSVPTFDWNFFNGTLLTVSIADANTPQVLYGLFALPNPNDPPGSGGALIPPIDYGNYGLLNTIPAPTAPAIPPALTAGHSYIVAIVTSNSTSATLFFKIN